MNRKKSQKKSDEKIRNNHPHLILVLVAAVSGRTMFVASVEWFTLIRDSIPSLFSRV